MGTTKQPRNHESTGEMILTSKVLEGEKGEEESSLTQFGVPSAAVLS